ncbi:hypothetical protein [Candidatus Vampirococcus lugosii]|uniref:YtxH domain-containing protein n=1 Tax=Candidatus Vampirococcus lugosii TaxID=2789015 RepID=A0ABS5QL76_9BACT|nr:hypothetical protein [Candidatus Vampirococcus lugosii]MBS8121538.1 hypothetical protein [Candidatus Vampirococcus lugosii]
MKNLFEKKINKVIIGGVIGTALLGFGGFSKSPKGKSFFSKLKNNLKNKFNFFFSGMKEMKRFCLKNVFKK